MNKKLLFTLLIAVFCVLIGVMYTNKKFKSDQLVNSLLAHNDSLRVGTNAEYPPFSFIENDTIVGFDIDLIKEVAQRLNKKIIIKNMSFISLIPQLQSGLLEVIAAGMSPTQERSQQVAFSKPYSSSNTLIAVVPTGQYHDASKNIMVWLKNKTIVVNEGFIGDFFITDQGFANKKLPSVSDALIALRTAQAQVFVTGSASMQPFFKQYGTKEFSSVVIPQTTEPISLVFNKDNKTLIQQMQAVLDQLEANGFITALKQRWHIDV